MTNILSLPTIAGSLRATANADWRDAIVFVESGTSVPVDITGIAFRSQVRSNADSAVMVLDLSTDAGTLYVDGPSGRLEWRVPRSSMSALSGGYVTDIVAMADGVTRNLCPSPLSLTVERGITRWS